METQPVRLFEQERTDGSEDGMRLQTEIMQRNELTQISSVHTGLLVNAL